MLDENRVLATDRNCEGPGCKNVPAYDGDPAADMGALAKRDRNHASVAWYSLCNEAGADFNRTSSESGTIELADDSTADLHRPPHLTLPGDCCGLRPAVVGLTRSPDGSERPEADQSE